MSSDPESRLTDERRTADERKKMQWLELNGSRRSAGGAKGAFFFWSFLFPGMHETAQTFAPSHRCRKIPGPAQSPPGCSSPMRSKTGGSAPLCWQFVLPVATTAANLGVYMRTIKSPTWLRQWKYSAGRSECLLQKWQNFLCHKSRKSAEQYPEL